jgi:hypothetical protein
MRDLVKAIRDLTGNLPSLPTIFPNGRAPVVHQTLLPVRVPIRLTLAHWTGPGETVFRFRKNRHLYKLINQAKRMPGLRNGRASSTFPPHLWNVDNGLRWFENRGPCRDGCVEERGAARPYDHTMTTDQAKLADLLPVPKTLKMA